MNVMQSAQGKWFGILSSYIDPVYLDGKHHPCPLCGGKDRFRYLDYQSSGSWVCNQCNPQPSDGMDLLEKFTRKTFKYLAKEIEEIIGIVPTDKPKPKKDPLPALNTISKNALPLSGLDPVTRYLKNRGIRLVPAGIRYIRRDYYENGKSRGEYDCMVARISDHEGNRKSYHITHLKNGEKAKLANCKKILPPDGTITGAGVYLGPVNRHMVVGEGIETTLAGMQHFKLSGIAAISAGGMESLILPKQVKMVTILGDNDATFTGQKAAYTLANRLQREGIYVEVVIPETEGNDFADEVTA